MDRLNLLAPTDSSDQSNKGAADFCRLAKSILLFLAGISVIIFCAWVAAPSECGWSPVILLSIDGFRPEYLHRLNLTHNLNKLSAMGIRAQHMVSQFPTKTFPNHYSIVTGLYPESHGIVSNSFFDPSFNDSFHYQSDSSNKNSKWWGGEPIWITAVKQGLKAYTMFWPGSEAEISGHRPSKYLSYSTDASKLSANDRVDLLFKWLETDRPDFVAMYFSGVDNAGHAFGPDSAAVNSSLAEIDQAVGRMMEGLKSRKLLGRSHVIIVSDHGMTSISRDKTIWIDESVDSSEFTLTDGTPVAFVLPNDPNNTISIFQRLQNASIDKHWSVYLKNDIPERFHYRDNIRIPPIIAIADLHYSLMLKRDGVLPLGGMHGYDNLLPDMFAIFIATGPLFRSADNDGTLITKPFENIDLYNVLAHLLRIAPAPNNGSISTMDMLITKA